jgi:hypothetical protein
MSIKKSEFDFNPLFFFIFVTTVVYFLLDPLFIIERVDVNTLLGVKISLQAITGSLPYLLMSLGAGLVVAFGSLLYLPKKLFVVLITSRRASLLYPSYVFLFYERS